VKGTKSIFVNNALKSPYFERKNPEGAIFNNEFVEVAITKQDSNYFLKNYCLSSSQIWLIPLVDACHSHLLHKIEEEKK
jgi:hypothetical protein